MAPVTKETLTFFISRTVYYNNYFSFRFVGSEMFGNTYKCTSYNLFKFLGYFPAYGALSLRTEMLGHLPQSLYQTVGRFIKNHCSMFLRKALQQALATLFLGKEALETEFVAGKAAVHKCRDQGSGTGQSLNLYPLLHTGAHKQETGIADAGGAGIAYQSHTLTREDTVLHKLDFLVLIELMVGLQGLMYVVMLQKH